MRKETIWCFTLVSLYVIMSSCASTKKIVYFNNIQDTKVVTDYANIEPIIQINDILSIIVSSQDALASAPFNAPNESTALTTSASSLTNRLTVGYLVNPKGDIQFPILGTIHVAGLTKTQLTDFITTQLKDRQLLVDPITTIRQLNYKVSVLGEVAHPGVFSVPNEKLNLLEAISFAGDITIYGRKDNILLIRENDKGEKTIKRINLSDPAIFSSPYYYLLANDILYVEPGQNRVARERSTMTIPVILSVISLLVVIFNTLK